MKIFFSKIKKTNKVLLSIYFFVLIEYLLSLIFFTKSLLLLTGIETLLRIIALAFFYLIFFVYFLSGIVLLFIKKYKQFVITSVIIVILVPILAYGSYTINTFYNEIDKISNKDSITYTSHLIAMKDYTLSSESRLGMIDDSEDIEGNELAKKIIAKEKLTGNEIKEYSDYFEMLSDLYDNQIDAIFVPNDYISMFVGEEDFVNIDDEVYVIYSISEQRKVKESVAGTDKDITEPFSILLVGVDSMTESRLSSNADTIMLLTFNPNTLNATILSIPRDTFVPIPCRNNTYAKINSSAVKGISCVIDTVENLVDIKIDYYATVNFRAVVDLVESLGGVTVDVEKPNYNTNHGHNCKGVFCEQDSRRRWGDYTIYITPGVQKLNGEQALAYARNRGQYTASDFDRNKHQQQVVEAVGKEAKNIRSINKFKDILSIISKNMDTNMSTEKILSFYNLGKSIVFNQKSDNDFISIQKTYLEPYSLPVYLPSTRRFTSAQGIYESSLKEISNAMKINLGLEKQELIKSFSYQFAENYELSVIGKGKRDNNKLETLPNFAGESKTSIEAWCNARNIVVNYETVGIEHPSYKSGYSTGDIIGQSIHHGVLMASSNITHLTIYVLNNTSTNPITPSEEDCNPLEDIACNPLISP